VGRFKGTKHSLGFQIIHKKVIGLFYDSAHNLRLLGRITRPRSSRNLFRAALPTGLNKRQLL